METVSKYLLIIFFVAIISLMVHTQDVRQPVSKKYCGSQIGQALSAVCRGNYNTLKRLDRYPRQTQWDRMYGDMPASDGTNLGYPYQTRSDATSLLGGKRRKKRWGVYNECCEKSCTRDELSSYCAASDRRRRR